MIKLMVFWNGIAYRKHKLLKKAIASVTVVLFTISYCSTSIATPADYFGENFEFRLSFARLYQELDATSEAKVKVEKVSDVIKNDLGSASNILIALHALKHQLDYEQIRELSKEEKLPLAFAARDAAKHYANPDSLDYNVRWAVYLFGISSQFGIQQSGLAMAYTYMLRDQTDLVNEGYSRARQYKHEAYLFREVKIGCLPNNAKFAPIPVSQDICDLAASEEQKSRARASAVQSSSSDLTTTEAGVLLLLGLGALGIVSGVLSQSNSGAVHDSNSKDWSRLNMEAVNRAELEFAFLE